MTALNCLTHCSTLLAVYVHNAGFVAQSIGAAYCITFGETCTQLPDPLAIITALQSSVDIQARVENVFGLEVFAYVKSAIDGCGHLEGLGLYRNSSSQEAKRGRGAVVSGSPVKELLS